MKIPVDIQIDFLWGEQHFQSKRSITSRLASDPWL